MRMHQLTIASALAIAAMLSACGDSAPNTTPTGMASNLSGDDLQELAELHAKKTVGYWVRSDNLQAVHIKQESSGRYTARIVEVLANITREINTATQPNERGVFVKDFKGDMLYKAETDSLHLGSSFVYSRVDEGEFDEVEQSLKSQYPLPEGVAYELIRSSGGY